MMRLSRKEIGSFWHFNDEFFKGKVWLPKSSKLFGSGRDALRRLFPMENLKVGSAFGFLLIIVMM